MKLYKTKSKMFGYKIGLMNDSIYVAVPKKYFDGPGMDGSVMIECDDQKRLVVEADKERSATFADKFNQGMNYTLYYFRLGI